MLKKLNLLLICLMMSGCASSNKPVLRGGSTEQALDFSETWLAPQYEEGIFRVGMLLPLTGKAAKQGQGLKNAAMMAMDDVKNPELILQFYDTKSTPEGARTAVQNALGQRVRLIIGPLSSGEVRAISEETVYNRVPVIAFSTSKDVLQPTVYTLGLLIDEQVNRIMSYAAAQGRSRFALLLPDNSTGIAVAKAAIASAALNRKKAALSALAAKGDISAQRQLKQLKTTNSMGDPGFDAVLIPEYGSKLKSIISMFGYYDVYAPEVKFLGTSIWESSSLNKESMIINSWYPTLSRYQSAYFSNKYSNLFGERPNSLYSFAYDAVALASALSKYQDSDDLNYAITNPDGYIGINGTFRLFANGSNQHSLDIMEIRSGGDTVVDAAPRRFSGDDSHYYNREEFGSYQVSHPQIFGKPQSEAETQIFGNRIYGGEGQEF